MSEEVNEIYTLQIERKNTEFEIIHLKFPEDDFGKKMVCLMLYNIAEHIDPAIVGEGK
jgi:hypothetical protein